MAWSGHYVDVETLSIDSETMSVIGLCAHYTGLFVHMSLGKV